MTCDQRELADERSESASSLKSQEAIFAVIAYSQSVSERPSTGCAMPTLARGIFFFLKQSLTTSVFSNANLL